MFYSLEHPRLSLRHVAFFFGLVALLAGSLIMAGLHSGPVILGSEMNDNGMVEYLCLGNGCDTLTDMRWSDS